MPDKWREITQEEEADIERHVNRIMRRIATARISVEDVLSEIDVMNLSRREQRAVLRRVNEILSELDADLVEEARASVEDTYEHGRALALVALGSFATVGAAKRHLRKQGKGNVHKSFISDEAESLTDDLLAATANTRRHVKRTVRKVAAEALRDGRRGRQGARPISRELTQRLRQELGASADMAITDAAGRRWKLNVYAEMAVRTKLAEAQVEGERNQAIEEGALYGVVSTHAGACERCVPWEGRILKLTSDAPGDYPTVEDAQAEGLLHPNCKHLVSPVSDFDLLPDRLRRINRL